MPAPRLAFSLVELVIVVAIASTLAAVAIAKMSRATEAADSNASSATIQTIQQAIERYNSDHGFFPSAANLEAQLTLYSDADGNTAATKSTTFRFGPYLKKGTGFYPSGTAGYALVEKKNLTAAKWVYVEATGAIAPNTLSSKGPSSP